MIRMGAPWTSDPTLPQLPMGPAPINTGRRQTKLIDSGVRDREPFYSESEAAYRRRPIPRASKRNRHGVDRLRSFMDSDLQ